MNTFILSVLNGANVLDMLPYDERYEDVEVELIVSYKIISDNHLAQAEAYRVSHVINYQAYKGYKIVKECEIDASKYPILDDMSYFITFILKQEKDQVLECLLRHQVYVHETTKGRNNMLHSRTKLEILPVRLRAKLINKSIVIYILSKE